MPVRSLTGFASGQNIRPTDQMGTGRPFPSFAARHLELACLGPQFESAVVINLPMVRPRNHPATQLCRGARENANCEGGALPPLSKGAWGAPCALSAGRTSPKSFGRLPLTSTFPPPAVENVL